MQTADRIARAIHDHRVRSAASDLLFKSLRPDELTSPKHVCLALSALAKGVYTSDHLSLALLHRFSLFPVKALKEQDIGIFLNACGHLRLQPRNLKTLLEAATASANDFTPQGLSNILHALSKIGVPESIDLNPLVDASGRSNFSTRQVAIVLQALAKLDVKIPRQLWRLCDETDFDAQSSSMILDALARVDGVSHYTTAQRLLLRVHDGGEQEIGVALNACAKLRIRDDDFLTWWSNRNSDLSKLSVQTLANAALAFAKLDWTRPIEGIVQMILLREINEVQHIGQALFACAVANLKYQAQLINMMTACKDVGTISFALEVQVVTALLNSGDSLEGLTLESLRLLQSFRIFGPKAAAFAAAESDAKTSRLHADVKGIVSRVVTLAVEEEVFEMPYFIDLVLR